ncbi:ATP-dependent helicase/nuclease subunit B [Arthrobacter ulcerisalmonis]|nr:PD-(D/E)XK nuclease family protein [Arthrobacter ulcerisalmonis]MDQ0665410.1 ATP-dependent helicase/nuclease subunit B [Arthrobacter ulcerisalmonis]
MKIEFGWHLDRAPWAYTQPGLNHVRVGRKGFTTLLQTRLGITRPDTPHAERISQYLQRLRSIDTPGQWFHASFTVDPWSTARELLEARDDAVSNGWDGRLPEHDSDLPNPSPLLRTLTAAECAPGYLAPSLADDTLELLKALDTPLPLGIEELILQHAEASFPVVWQRIIGKLRGHGVRVSTAPPATAQPELTVLTAETEWEAAEHAARWLASGDNSSTAVACSDSTSVLDQYLARHSLPRLGVGARSPWRAQDQLIPLFFELIWAPADVRLLAEFLSLPGSPVRRRAAHHLLQALQQAPGTGGAVWKEAIEEISKDDNLGADLAAALDSTFNSGLIVGDITSGANLAGTAMWLAGRLRARAAVDPVFQSASAQLQRILELVAPLPEVSRRELRRIVSAVVTPTSNPLVAAEASPWLRLNHLHELGDDVDNVLWWGFRNESTAAGRRWDAHDVETLARVGVDMPSQEDLAALSIQQTLASASRCRHLVIVQVEQLLGERTPGDPLLETLVAAQPSLSAEGAADSLSARLAKLSITPVELTGPDGRWRFAGRSAQLVPVDRHLPVPPAPVHEVGPSPSLRPERLSFSQLSTLLGCSLAWVLGKKSQLHVADAASIPTDNQMLGTFAHKVVEVLHNSLRPQNRAVPDEPEIRRTIEELLPHYASELLLPGQRRRRAAITAILVASISTFFSQLSRGGITLQDVEREFEKDVLLSATGEKFSVAVKGSADAVGIDTEGRTVVVDLKWTNNAKYRREEIRQGTALQLALYQWALHSGDVPPDDPTAFYLLKQGTFASSHTHFGAPLPRTIEPAQLWTQAVAAAEFTIEEVLAGRITATQPADDARAQDAPDRAQVDADAGRHHIKPPCRFCNFGVLCGLKGDFS